LVELPYPEGFPSFDNPLCARGFPEHSGSTVLLRGLFYYYICECFITVITSTVTIKGPTTIEQLLSDKHMLRMLGDVFVWHFNWGDVAVHRGFVVWFIHCRILLDHHLMGFCLKRQAFR
jgi:hypothetical protein